MQRRAFTAGIGAVLVGGGLARRSLADAGDILNQGAMRALRIRYGDGEFETIDGFEISDRDSGLGSYWNSGARVYYEDRVDLSGAGGGVGELFRTPFRIRWSRARAVADIRLNGSYLSANTRNADTYMGQRLTVGVGDYSWDIRPQLAPATVDRSNQGRVIGTLRQEDDGHLLVSLNATPAF